MRFFTFIFSLFFVFQAMASGPSDLRSFGGEAPVQFYLFTSPGCPFCANFHQHIFPTLKKEYVNTGKAQMIIVDIIHGANSLVAIQAIRCLEGDKSNKLEDDLYTSQSKWLKKDEPEAKRVIASYASRQGMTQDQFNKCLSDKELQKSIITQQANLAQLYEIKSFPTLVMRDGNEVRKWTGSDKKAIIKGLKEAFQK